MVATILKLRERIEPQLYLGKVFFINVSNDRALMQGNWSWLGEKMLRFGIGFNNEHSGRHKKTIPYPFKF